MRNHNVRVSGGVQQKLAEEAPTTAAAEAGNAWQGRVVVLPPSAGIRTRGITYLRPFIAFRAILALHSEAKARLVVLSYQTRACFGTREDYHRLQQP